MVCLNKYLFSLKTSNVNNSKIKDINLKPRCYLWGILYPIDIMDISRSGSYPGSKNNFKFNMGPYGDFKQLSSPVKSYSVIDSILGVGLPYDKVSDI